MIKSPLPGTPMPTCYLMGAQNMLPMCGDLLRQAGFRILGVVSDTPAIAAWASSVAVPAWRLEDDWAGAMARERADYLFTITHLQLLDEAVRALPLRGAINFHDAPLPDYAGLYCPVWALLDEREQYGVSWHWIDAGIDTGRLLEQERFDVDADETTLSLNAKALAAGLASFERLINRIRLGDDAGRAQAGARLRLCLRDSRPPGAGLLDFSGSARALERLVRALHFGPYENPFASATVLVDGQAFVVAEAQALDGAAPAGTVVACHPDDLRIACADGVLRIRALSTLDGQPVPIASLGLEAGAVVAPLDDYAVARHEALVREAARSEPQWLRQLRALEPVHWPFQPESPDTSAGAATRDGGTAACLPIGLPSGFGAGSEPAARATLLAAAWVAWLAHARPAPGAFHLAFADGALRERIDGVERLWQARVPIGCDPSGDAPLDELAATLARTIDAAAGRGPIARDLALRYPELKAQAIVTDGRMLPLGLAFGDPRQAADASGRPPVVGDDATLWIDAAGTAAWLVCDPARIGAAQAALAARYFGDFVAAFAGDPSLALKALPMAGPAERERMQAAWADVRRAPPATPSLAAAFEAQVDRRPQAVAVRHEDASITYAELDERANRLAHHLLARGVRPDEPVALHLERSIELAVAYLAILKAGAGYLPLDPAFPADRIHWMLENSGARIAISQSTIVGHLQAGPGLERVLIDADWPGIARCDAHRPGVAQGGATLAYLIYTSGSSGKPKGVAVEQRNVLNFFAAMDERLGPLPEDGFSPGTWLAVTSLSFDISVLELLWTLCRGFEVVVYRDRSRSAAVPVAADPEADPGRPLDFSVFLWGNDDGPGSSKYRLTLSAARRADELGFKAIWTPERHFHAFGGPFPNPSVVSAAIAAITTKVQIRAGSVVMPLHHPIRVAEEWALVDNLSDGRVGISFASGWQPDDFVLAPGNYSRNKQAMAEGIDAVRRLWRGEEVAFENPMGIKVPKLTLPRPVQPELPFWITSAGNPDTYREAGLSGGNLLTHLLGQSVEEVAGKIAIYRAARAEAGLDPMGGTVTLMLHTFVGESAEQVRQTVHGPLKSYLGASVGLVKKYAWTFPAFRRPAGKPGEAPPEVDLSDLTAEESDAVLEHAFNRYFEQSGLFGTIDECLERVARLRQIGVDEIGCLIDYGVPTDTILGSFDRLADLMRRANEPAFAAACLAAVRQPAFEAGPGDVEADRYSLASLLESAGITHLQCTPSHARMILDEDRARRALSRLRHCLIGGEACPPDLAAALLETVGGRVTNMYGPTETTIWSTTGDLAPDGGPVTIGTPIANTRTYVMDRFGALLPPGMPGRLWIGGAGVTRGYHGRDDLTAERFRADPQVPGERMYDTGDRAVADARGELVFLGRADDQVKVRGYRIEPGEIEVCLRAQAGIGDAVVVVREDRPGDQRLVAYVVAHGGAFDENALREGLRAELPEYMVPAAFVGLSAIPKTPNGKIDRRALPAPAAAPVRRPAVAAAEPESDLQRQIVQRWKVVLAVDEVGLDDDFFELGGHSLLVVKLHRDLRAELAKPLSLTDIYRFPTVRRLSDFLSRGETRETVDAGARRGEMRRSALASRRQRMTSDSSQGDV